GMIGVGVQASNGATVVAPKASETPVVESLRSPSPLARRIAAEHNVDISQVRGTRPHGRVTKDDVISYLSQASQQATTPTQATAAQTPAPMAQPAVQPAAV